MSLPGGASVLAAHATDDALIVVTRDRAEAISTRDRAEAISTRDRAEAISTRDDGAARGRIPGANFRADGVAFVRRIRPSAADAATAAPSHETLLLRSTTDGRVWAWRIPGGDIAWRTPPGALLPPAADGRDEQGEPAAPRVLDSAGAWSCWLHAGSVWAIRSSDGLIGGRIALGQDRELLAAAVREGRSGPALLAVIRDRDGCAALELPIFAPGEALRPGGNQLRNRAVDHPPRALLLSEAPVAATALLLADRVVLHDADQLRVYHLRRAPQAP
ncbi:MAG: hypothetical protein IPM64_02855 [Phycisphaerales bacterium]|nr:hypothetical protein [Phycisphaerales bacterium]